MILFMKFWNFDSIERDNVYQSLLKNCMNRSVTKIVIVVERYTPISLIHSKIQVINIDGEVDDHLIFNLSYEKYPNKLCCISDPNLIFNENVVELYGKDMSGVIIWENKWIYKSFDIKISNVDFRDNLYRNFEIKTIKDFTNVNSMVENIGRDDHIRNQNINVNESIPKRIIRGNMRPNLIKTIHNEKICIIIHLYYQDLWSEFENLLKNMEGIDYDLYVSLVENSSTLGQTMWIKEKIEKIGGVVYILPNKGLDIGPFIYIIGEIIKSNKSYDQVIKLHSKKSLSSSKLGFGDRWRSVLTESLIGSVNIVNSNISKLKDDKIGMLGSDEWLISDTNGNDIHINSIKNSLGVNGGNLFIGGTMFWIKFNILKKYLNIDNIYKLYENLEEGYFTDTTSTNTHALERIFGYMVQDSGYDILGV